MGGNEGHEGSGCTESDEEEGSHEGHEGDEEEGSHEGDEGDEEEGGHEGHEGDEEEGSHEGHESDEEEGGDEGNEEVNARKAKGPKAMEVMKATSALKAVTD